MNAGALPGGSAAPAGIPGRPGLVAAGLALAALALYAPVATHEFTTFDDPLYLTANPHVQQGLTRASAAWALTATHAANWHPLTWLSLMAGVDLFGLEPAGHLLTNVALHAANTVLVFLLFRRASGEAGRSALVALVFAVHPLHVESVAWLAERKDVLSAFLGLLSLYAYAGYALGRGRAGYGWALAWLCLGLTAKPSLVSVPLLMLALDVWPLRRWVPGAPGAVRAAGRLLAEKVPFLAAAALVSAVTVAAQSAGSAVWTAGGAPGFGARAANAAVATAVYLRRAFAPTDLSVYYPHPGAWPAATVAASALALAALSLLALAGLRRAPYVAAGWAWTLAALGPALGLLQVGGQAMADRYMYWPLAGVAAIPLWASAALAPRLRRVAAVAAVAWLAGSALLARERIAEWRDSETLYRSALREDPANCMAHYNLANLLYDAGRYAEAERHYRGAVAGQPADGQAWQNLGVALLQQGRAAEAREAVERALRLNPLSAPAWCNLGILLEREDPRGAAHCYGRALKLDPGLRPAALGLARVAPGATPAPRPAP